MTIEDGLWTAPGERTGGRGEEPRCRLVPEQGRRNLYLQITPTDHFLESLVAGVYHGVRRSQGAENFRWS